MNIMTFSTHIGWPSHYETELELIQGHLDIGDHILQAVCNEDLPICDCNPLHLSGECIECISMRVKGKSLLSGRVNTVPILNLTRENRREIDKLKIKFSDIEDLKSHILESFDIGYGVASSLISWFRDPYPDVVKYKDVIEAYLNSSLQVYRSTQNYLDSHDIDQVYVFNGRYAHVRAIFRACQSRGVECVIHERGHSINHYALYSNVLPHSIANTESLMLSAWASAPDQFKREIGTKFYLDRAAGIEQSWYSFVKDQGKDLLPDKWDENAENVVIYNSSEDEFASIGSEWKNPLYCNQLDAINRIVVSLEQEPDHRIHIYLRMHPNNKNLSKDELCKWYVLESSLLTIIPHDSPISTYALLRKADKVLTFGSTVGIESVFWGKPSILAGNSFYRNLGGTYNPATHEELIQLLKQNLAQKAKTPALMYGFYLSTFGIPFKYSMAQSFDTVEFMGVDLKQFNNSFIVAIKCRISRVVSRLVAKLFSIMRHQYI